jgi:hypothetical protein
MMLAGALTDSPMWLPTAVYWIGWALAHVVWWLVVTPTRNMEAIAPAASLVYWSLVYWSAGLAAWGWRKTKTSYGVREAVDFGDNARKLGRMPVKVIRWQTRTRVWVAAWGLLVGSMSLATLAFVGLAGAWTLVFLAALPIVKVRRMQRLRRWGKP